MTEAIASLQVNDVTVNWVASDKRALKRCQFCHEPTYGRVASQADNRTQPACFLCAMDDAFGRGKAKLLQSKRLSSGASNASVRRPVAR